MKVRSKRNLTNGTKPTATSAPQRLTVHEVALILKTCHETHVQRLDWSGLKVSFRGFGSGITRPATKSEQTLADLIEEQTIEEQELALKEQRMATMAIDDPAALEEMVTQNLTEEIPHGDGEPDSIDG